MKIIVTGGAGFIASNAGDPLGRAGDCRGEIDFALFRDPVAHGLLDLHTQGLIPERVTHNETKLSNVLIDDQTGEGICVVDLDTIMPGLSLYDFGDLVRTCVSPVEEDSTNFDAIEVRMPIFEALARGFLEEMNSLLTPCETPTSPSPENCSPSRSASVSSPTTC
jgi:hypothetical protein